MNAALHVCSEPAWRSTWLYIGTGVLCLALCALLVWAAIRARTIIVAGLILTIGAGALIWVMTESAIAALLWLSELGGCT